MKVRLGQMCPALLVVMFGLGIDGLPAQGFGLNVRARLVDQGPEDLTDELTVDVGDNVIVTVSYTAVGVFDDILAISYGVAPVVQPGAPVLQYVRHDTVGLFNGINEATLNEFDGTAGLAHIINDCPGLCTGFAPSLEEVLLEIEYVLTGPGGTIVVGITPSMRGGFNGCFDAVDAKTEANVFFATGGGGLDFDENVPEVSSLTLTALPPAQQFRRGDPNADGQIRLGDAITILLRLFAGGASLTCRDAGDFDDNGSLGVNDAVGILVYLFLLGPPPSAPFPSCGTDPSENDGLSCDEATLGC